MQSNATRKETPKNQETAKIDKEAKKQEIAELFAQVKERTGIKSLDLARMQKELFDLLDKIPTNGSGSFKKRLKDFEAKLKRAKARLTELSAGNLAEADASKESANEDLEDLSEIAVQDLVGADGNEPPSEVFQTEGNREILPVATNVEQSKNKDTHFSELKNFRDYSESILNGVIDEKVKGKPIFRGSIKLDNGDSYSGFAVPMDGTYQFQGDGMLEQKGGAVYWDGSFERGKLKNGHHVENLKDGQTRIEFIENFVPKFTEIGHFNENNELQGIGQVINFDKNTKKQGNFVNGEFLDGYVVDAITGKQLERWKDGQKIELGDNLPSKASSGLPERAAVKSEIEKSIEQVNKIAQSEKPVELSGFVDARGQVLNGSSVVIEGVHYFSGKIDTLNGRYEGIAVLNDKEHAFDLEDGTLTSSKRGFLSVSKIDKGVIVEREMEISQMIKDAKGTVMTKGKKVEARDRIYYEGQFRMPNGKIYEGKAKFKDGKFDWSEENGDKGVLGKAADKFKGWLTRKKETKLEISKQEKLSEFDDQEVPPETPETLSEIQDLLSAQEVVEKVSQLDQLDNFVDAYGQILNGKLTHTPDGKHIFEGKIEKHGVHEYQYEGKAVLNADGMFEPYENQDESNTESQQVEAEQPQEKGRMRKFADAYFNKTGAKIVSEASYKTAASYYGVKIVSDSALAGLALVLEKIGKDQAATAIGEYSDVYKYYAGKDQIAEIKNAFREFLDSIKPAEGENMDENLVEAKYLDIKQKIDKATQLNPEAKAKYLAKLEKLKASFDAKGKKLEQQELDEMAQYEATFLVNKTAGMQIVRDGLNGLTKAAVVAGTLGTGGMGLAAGAVVAKSAAIARVFAMATTKVMERNQKRKRLNEQTRLEEGKEAVGILEDSKLALLETMHGLSGGFFNGGKDVRTGEKLTEIARLANFAKSLGNVVVGIGVMLGLRGETVGAVAHDFLHKADQGHDGNFSKELAHGVDNKLQGKGVRLPDSAKVATVVVATEAQAVVGVAGVSAEANADLVHAGSAAGVPEAGQAVAVEASGSSSASEILSVKDVAKVHDFSTWRNQMMESMGYKIHGGKIDHALLFHPGAKLELVGADGKVVDIYEFKKGGSTWAAMDKFHKDHSELFKGKDGAPGIRIVDTGDDKHPTVKVLDRYRVESHVGGKTQMEVGQKTENIPKFDKTISTNQEQNLQDPVDLMKNGFKKVSLDSFTKDHIPKGYHIKYNPDGSTNGAKTVGGGWEITIFKDGHDSESYLYAQNHSDALANVLKVQTGTGRIFNTLGHVGNLDSGKPDTSAILDTKSGGSGGDGSSAAENSSSKTIWSKGDAVDPTLHKNLDALIHPSKSAGGSVEASAPKAPIVENVAAKTPGAAPEVAPLKGEVPAPTVELPETVPAGFKEHIVEYQTLQNIERGVPEAFSKNLNINLNGDKAGIMGKMLRRMETALSTTPSLLDNPDIKSALDSTNAGLPVQDRLKNILKVLDSTNSLILNPEERILLGSDFVKGDNFEKFVANIDGKVYDVVTARDGSGAISYEDVSNHARIFETKVSGKFNKHFVDLFLAGE